MSGIKFASAGEYVTCIDGHRVYRLLSDLNISDLLRADTLEPAHPDAIAPVGGALIPSACPECGKPFHRPGRMHLERGWSDDLIAAARREASGE